MKKEHKEKSKRKSENEDNTDTGKTLQMSLKLDRSVKVAQIKKDKKPQPKKKKEISEVPSNALGEEDNAIDAEPDHIVNEQNVSSSIEVVRKKKGKKLLQRKKKEESEGQNDDLDEESNHMDAEPGNYVDEQNGVFPICNVLLSTILSHLHLTLLDFCAPVGSSVEEVLKKKNKKSKQRKEKEGSNGQSDVTSDPVNHMDTDAHHSGHEQNDNSFEVVGKKKDKKSLRRKKKEGQSDIPDQPKKKRKKRKKDRILSGKGESLEKSGPVLEDIYEISSGDEDNSRGMRKWLMEYHQSRPGLKVLQQRIDEFIVAHEEKLEQERKEREALAAEGGWTVVSHHKGRKKTADFESGTVVGSVSQAALEDKMGKKKRNEVALDFYRFQRREAQRNEVMELQSKFEQDKKRIQQLRASRKFRPY